MITWWSGLTPLNQLFWVLVVFFTTLFAWQFVASFTGFVGEGGPDLDGDGDLGDGDFADADGDLDGDGISQTIHRVFLPSACCPSARRSPF